MGRKSDISVEEKTTIICLAQEGIKTAEIAARLGRHPAAVRKKYRCFQEAAADHAAVLFQEEAWP